MNELLVWWYLFVNSNIDLIIMTITLIVVAGLVLEVVRLRKSINTQVVDLWEDASDTFYQLCEIEEKFERKFDDQVKVNVHLAEDIIELQKRFAELKLKRKAIKK